MIELTDFIDPHVHASPEHVPRLLDDAELVRQAAAAKMGGVLIKSHVACTAARAVRAAKQASGIRVWGGLVLNNAAGGIDPQAVEAALRAGAAEIWMPTLDAANHRKFYCSEGDGIRIGEHRLSGNLYQVLDLIAEHQAILGTGHLGTDEICTLIPIARERGIKKILVTHPEAPFIDMSVSVQRELVALGCLFERTWVFTTAALGRVLTADRMISDIQAVGFESTVLATDMGQIGNPSPVGGFEAFVQACHDAGFNASQVRRMAKENIAQWLV